VSVIAASPRLAPIRPFSPRLGKAPVPFDVVRASSLPLDAFPPCIANYAAEIAKANKVPIDLVLSCMLGAMAAAAARRAEVRIGGTHREPVNLFVAAVAGSGERKSAALRAALEILQIIEQELRASKRPEIAKALCQRRIEEARLKQLTSQAAKGKTEAERTRAADEAKALETKLTQVPSAPKLLVSNVTPEKLEILLAEQGGAMCVASEEAGSFFDIAGGLYAKDGGAQLDTFLQSYDGGRIVTERVTRAGAEVDRPALTLILTPQPVILAALREHPEFQHRGLIGRIIFAVPPSLVGTRLYENYVPDPKSKSAYAAAIRSILDLSRPDDPMLILCIQVEGEALEVWRGFHDRLELEQAPFARLEGIREWASKHAGRVARIAALFHLVEYPGHDPRGILMHADTMRRAVRVGEALVEHALAAHALMGADPAAEAAQYVLAWIRKHGKGAFSKKEIFDGTRGRFHRVALLEPVLALLEERHYLRRLPQAERLGPGRLPSQTYEVNSLWLSQNAPDSPKPPAALDSAGLADSADEKEHPIPVFENAGGRGGGHD
jgi:hypothetical protein